MTKQSTTPGLAHYKQLVDRSDRHAITAQAALSHNAAIQAIELEISAIRGLTVLLPVLAAAAIAVILA